jgi:hypothetical protein
MNSAFRVLTCSAAFAAAVVCASAVPSRAATVGPLSETSGTVMAVGDNANFSTDQQTTSPFSAEWFFNVVTPFTVQARASNTPDNITSFSLEIWNDLGTVLTVAPPDTLVNSVIGANGLAFLQILNLPAGNYYVRVSGPFSLSNSGAVSGNISILSAVPLPPAALLFCSALVGLGILGRRRRKQSGERVAAV